MSKPFTILNVLGPFREPREPAFSFDYSVQRPDWATPQGIRVKVALQEELERVKSKMLEIPNGSPGQQLRINQIVVRAIADQKLHIANVEGMFQDRRDVMIEPFTDSLSHLFVQLEQWIENEGLTLRKTIQDQVGL
ncbi:MAG: hypothetical protein GKS05_12845 [Nitrospirales bacterium]|nr:hypothetical protein [Nitrospirales bacterium]